MANLQKQTLIELCKLYPKIKIPYLPEYQYYLDLQAMFDSKIENIVRMAKACEIFVDTFDITKYKYAESEKIIKYFKENGYLDKLNAVELTKLDGKQHPSSFTNYKSEKHYLSIDLKEANWSIFKKYAGLDEAAWTDFVTLKFDLHPFLAHSKQFRQIIFGNLNPGRIASLQKREIANIVEHYAKPEWRLVMLSTDEAIFELDEAIDIKLIDYKSDIPLNFKQFKMKQITSRNDTFYIQTEILPNWLEKKSLKGVPGNRYFIHLKEQMTDWPFVHEDLIFEAAPKQHAKWIL